MSFTRELFLDPTGRKTTGRETKKPEIKWLSPYTWGISYSLLWKYTLKDFERVKPFWLTLTNKDCIQGRRLDSVPLLSEIKGVKLIKTNRYRQEIHVTSKEGDGRVISQSLYLSVHPTRHLPWRSRTSFDRFLFGMVHVRTKSLSLTYWSHDVLHLLETPIESMIVPFWGFSHLNYLY